MKIAIISDIHDNHVNLQAFLKWAKENQIGEIICCGDVTNDETLKILSEGFRGSIELVRGNADIYQESDIKKYKNINFQNRIGVVEHEKKFIGFCHEPFLIEKVCEKLKEKLAPCSVIFYGHTHEPWISEKDEKQLVNPGTLGGMFTSASFGYFDTENGELKLQVLDIVSKNIYE